MSPDEAFSEISKQVQLIDDLIMSDIRGGFDNTATEGTLKFKKHLITIKYWFFRISNANKKRFVISLVKDIRSATAISLLLKSIWNCRPKDAVLSVSCKKTWSCYDQPPMDHNRTALPFDTLVQVVNSDREWFQTLQPEPQARVLLELLSIAGGPIMWTVLHKAKTIYNRYRNDQLQNIQKLMIVLKPPMDMAASPSIPTLKLQMRLEEWNAIIKSLKASFNLEEVEMFFKVGSAKKIWKVNRKRPEATETVDFLQLLPAVIGKLILSYLPHTQLGSCAHVNRYWAYLVDDIRHETHVRRQLEIDIIKLESYIFPLEISSHTDTIQRAEVEVAPSSQRLSNISTAKIQSRAKFEVPVSRHSLTNSELRQKTRGIRSCGKLTSSSIIINDARNKKKPTGAYLPPIRNMADMSEKLNRRGAVDNNLWQWCETALKRGADGNRTTLPSLKGYDGIMAFKNMHFPGPLTVKSSQLPPHPLSENPVTSSVPVRLLMLKHRSLLRLNRDKLTSIKLNAAPMCIL